MHFESIAEEGRFGRSHHRIPSTESLIRTAYPITNCVTNRFYSSRELLWNTVKPRFTDTHFYGQFSLSLGKESPYTFSKFNPLNMDTPLIQTLSMASSVSILKKFDCIFIPFHGCSSSHSRKPWLSLKIGGVRWILSQWERTSTDQGEK